MRPVARVVALAGLATALVIVSACSRNTGDPEAARTHVKNGNTYVQQGKYPEAIVEYRNAVKQDAKSGEARSKLAAAYLKTGDPRNAYREAVRAADLLPSNADAQIEAVKLLLWGGRFEDAKTRIETVLKADPRNVKAQILLGNALAGLKDFDQALTELEEAVRIDPTSSEAYTSLAAVSAAKGQRPEAEAAFKKATAVAPDSMDAHLALANYYWASGQMAQAEIALQEARAIDPTHIGVNKALATFYVTAKRPAEAEGYIKAVADLAKDSPSRLTLADYYIASGRPAEATAILQEVAKDSASFAAAQARTALVEYSTGRGDAAHQTLAKGLAKAPNDAGLLLADARILLAEGKLDAALKSTQSAIKADPQSAPAQYLAGLIHTRRRDAGSAKAAFNEVLKLNPRAASAQIALANLELRANQPDASANLARAALAQQPDSAAAKLVLAQSLIARGQLDQAATELSTLLEKYPRDGSVHLSLGMLALAKRDGGAARKSFEQALVFDPSLGQALAGIVSLDLSAGKVKEARARVESRLKETPGDSSLWMLSARVSLTSRDLAGGEGALRKAIEVDPSNFDAYAALGRLYLVQGKLDQARGEMERLAARQSKGGVGAATMVGAILELQGKRSEARKQYENVIAIDPNAAVAANNLAWIYAEDGANLNVALQLAQVAVARFPDRANVIDTLGWVYFKMGLVSQAITQFEQSVAKEPRTADFAYHLGAAHAKQGEWEKARPLLERALQLNPRFAGAEDAKQVLKNVQG